MNKLNSTYSKSSFTLTEVTIVIAIFAILITLLIPSLRNMHRHALEIKCQNQMKQHACAMALYSGDYDDSFPTFGGKVENDYSSFYRTGAGGNGTVMQLFEEEPVSASKSYFFDYMNCQLSLKGQEPFYCPSIDWMDPQAWSDPIPLGDSLLEAFHNVQFSGSLAYTGYAFFTGRKKHNPLSSFNLFDTRARRYRGDELLMGDLLIDTTASGSGGGHYWKESPYFFNPHEGAHSVPMKLGTAHQLFADGAIERYETIDATQVFMAGGAGARRFYAKAQKVVVSSSMTDGSFYVKAP